MIVFIPWRKKLRHRGICPSHLNFPDGGTWVSALAASCGRPRTQHNYIERGLQLAATHHVKQAPRDSFWVQEGI